MLTRDEVLRGADQQYEFDLEDAVQKIIAIASSPPVFQNDLSCISSCELIKLIGADSATREGTPRLPARVGAGMQSRAAGSHAVPTILLVQKRLGEEFRHLCGFAQDENEERMQNLRREYDEAEQAIRSAHLERLKSVLASDVGEVIAPHLTIKVQSKASVELLEQKLLHDSAADDESSTGDIRTKRLTTFWKARYEAAARKLSEEQQLLMAANTRLAEQVQLNGSDPSSLMQLLQTMRDVETREKEKLSSIRSHYVRECQRQGATPEEVSESLMPPPGRGSDSQGVGAQAEAKTFTVAGFKSSSVRLLAILLSEKMSVAASANIAAAQLAKSISQLQQQLDEIQNQFCKSAGSASSAAGGKLLEEIVHLRAEVELRDAHLYNMARRALQDQCSQRQRISQLRMDLESSRCKHKERIMAKYKELADLDVQLFQIRHAGSGGDSCGGILPDVQLLQSKLIVLENELKLLKSERSDMIRLAEHMKRAVDQRQRSSLPS
jgi:hypothetical protein